MAVFSLLVISRQSAVNSQQSAVGSHQSVSLSVFTQRW